MGPPISTWPYSHPNVRENIEKSDNEVQKRDSFNKKCILFRLVGPFRLACLNLTFVMLVLQLILAMNTVRAGPVVFNLDYYQGPSPIARNIRHLPCISRKTSQEGLCMFAIDCLKANGTHLGTCIDRFYFGSCCQIPDKTVLPQIIGNDIEDNGIDGADFVHPQTEDTIESTVSKVPEYIFPTRKPITTQKVTVATTTILQISTTPSSHSEVNYLENKSGDGTTLDSKIPNENIELTTAVTVEATTKSFTSQQTQKVSVLSSTTDIPIKLSTFQSVSVETNNVPTPKPTNINENVANTTLSTITEQTVLITTQASTTQQTPKKPIRPTYKPRPSSKPSNFTRPQPISNTTKPKPLAPSSIYNTTRLPYRPPPRRPSTRKPLPLPPRLNITIIPHTTSSKPPFTRPSTASITFINTLASTIKETPVTTKLTTTSTSPIPVTTTTITPSSSSSRPPITAPEKATEVVTLEVSSLSSNDISTEKSTDTSTLSFLQPLTTESDPTKSSETANPVASITSSTEKLIVTMEPFSEKENKKPTTESETSLPLSSSTEFPPLVTWSSTIDATTKSPENITVANNEVWSPITPPEGWVLISTVPPKPNTSSKTTTTTTESPTTFDIETTSSFLPTKIETTLTETTVLETEMVTDKSPSSETPSTSNLPISSPSTQSSTSTTTEKATSQQVTTSDAPLLEFTVNVTISPTVPTSTSSIGLTTFSSVTTQNVTAVSNVTESLGSTVTDSTMASPVNVSTVTVSVTEAITTPKPLNMSNFKEVCGRRMWPEARIVGGNKSGFGMWPWQISLRQYRTSTYLHKCGAALLNENWAITAAHCVEGVPPSELLIRLGEHDLANDNEPYGYAERRVQLVASHPHFDPSTFEYDLALLRFVEPVSFQPNILPVCVPDNDDNYVGRTAHVTGWGRLYDDGPLPSVLQEVQVPVINNTACEGMYQEAGYNEHIPNIFICAGWKRGGADSCEGDSGGPMVIQRERDGRFVLSGIISWGIGCAEPNQPGVYTRISEFRDWINQILQF